MGIIFKGVVIPTVTMMGIMVGGALCTPDIKPMSDAEYKRISTAYYLEMADKAYKDEVAKLRVQRYKFKKRLKREARSQGHASTGSMPLYLKYGAKCSREFNYSTLSVNAKGC
jgi:hypothetical protein